MMDDPLDGEALEEHIASLLAQAKLEDESRGFLGPPC